MSPQVVQYTVLQTERGEVGRVKCLEDEGGVLSLLSLINILWCDWWYSLQCQLLIRLDIVMYSYVACLLVLKQVRKKLFYIFYTYCGVQGDGEKGRVSSEIFFHEIFAT